MDTLLDARTRFFAAQGIPADGGYNNKWVPIVMGPLRFAIPNAESRKRAVRLHDLHHVLTGYNTDWQGEGAISAFEIGGGCGRYAAAWVLNLYGILIGLVVDAPGTFAAFVRGRRSRNLYPVPFSEGLLQQTVEQTRAALQLDADQGPPRRGEKLAFAGWVFAALLHAVAPLAALAGVGWVLFD